MPPLALPPPTTQLKATNLQRSGNGLSKEEQAILDKMRYLSGKIKDIEYTIATYSNVSPDRQEARRSDLQKLEEELQPLLKNNPELAKVLQREKFDDQLDGLY